MSETKEKLLNTAIDLIWEQSYGSVSVDDICKTSGVKKGSFYHFFPSKSDLAVAAYEAHWCKYKALYEELFAKSKPGLKRIEDWCDRVYVVQKEIYDAKGKVLGCPYASVGSELSTQDENVRRKAQELFNNASKYLEVAITDAIADKTLSATIHPMSMAQELMSYVIGLLLNARIQNSLELIRTNTRRGVMSLLGAFEQSKAA